MTLPVMHLVLEDRSDQRVEPGAAVEGSHQPFDHRLVDAGARDDVRDDQIAAWCAGLRVHSSFSLVRGAERLPLLRLVKFI